MGVDMRCGDKSGQSHPVALLWAWGCLLAAAPMSGNAQADGLCGELRSFIEGTRNTAVLEQGSPSPAWPNRPQKDVVEAGDCQFSKTLDGNLYHCHWAYEYRAPSASQHFERLSRDVECCLGDTATLRLDQRVNHPDSFSQRLYDMEKTNLGLSLKDKSALGKTLVFLTLETVRED